MLVLVTPQTYVSVLFVFNLRIRIIPDATSITF